MTEAELNRLFRDILTKKVKLEDAQDAAADYGISQEEWYKFVVGRESKTLCMNADFETVERCKGLMRKMGITYEDRSYTLRHKMTSYASRYDFSVEMTSEEYDALCRLAEEERNKK